ncbi:hypothetical protein REPUB_Repub08aG0111200 [Reevesia pubescens]
MEKGSVRGKKLNMNIQVDALDSGNEIENGEEVEVHTNAEQKSVEGEPCSAGIEVIKFYGFIDDSYSNKEDDDGERKQESRGDQGKNEDIEVSDVNEVPQLNHDSLTDQKKEKQLEILVGGLHKDAVEQDFFEIFGKFGEVQIARIMRHPTTNKSKGYAFIQYATVVQAKKVLSDLKDGIEVRGKRVNLSISRECDILYLGNICKTWTKEDVVGKLKGYEIEDIDEIQVPNDPKNVKTIYVEGIPKFWDVQKLKEICEKYGETKKVKISRNLGNKGKDFGFISFTTRESAVACVVGMNKLQFGEDVKVKADIARPLVGGRLQRALLEDLNLIRGIEAMDPLNSKHTIEGETNQQKNIAHDAGAGLYTKPEKTDGKRKNRKRRRDRISQVRPSHSSGISKSRSHLRKGPDRGADSIAYRKPYKEAYAALTQSSGYGVISGSKRLSSNLEPGAGFAQPVKHKDQYHAACVTPAFRHRRKSYAGYLKPDTHYERQPPAKYFKPAIGKDALPHAGFLEPAFRKQSFDVEDYPARRTGEYNGPDNQGPAHGAGSACSLPYVPKYMSYARFEANVSASGYHRVSGAYPPTETHY